jgi:hypothetical protein
VHERGDLLALNSRPSGPRHAGISSQVMILIVAACFIDLLWSPPRAFMDMPPAFKSRRSLLLPG